VCGPFVVPFGPGRNETMEVKTVVGKIVVAAVVAQERVADGLGHAGVYMARGLAW